MKKIIITMIFSSISIASYAENNDGNVYFDVGAGAAKINNLPTGAAAGNINWGYSFNEGFGLEAGWTAMPSKQWGHLDNYNIYDLAAKGTIPMGQVFDLYGRLGLGGAYSSWTGTCPDPTYKNQGSAWGGVGIAGIGVAFNLDPSYSLYLENNNYIPFSSQKGAFGYTSALFFGFEYKFGKSNIQSNPVQQNISQPEISSTPPSEVIIAAPPLVAIAESSESPIIYAHKPAFESRIFTDDGGRYIIVQKGDNLYNISCGTDVYVTTLQTKNNLKGNIIKIGNKLYLDDAQYIPQSEYDRFNQRIHTENNRRYFEAICGDDLLKASRLSGININHLSKINNIKNVNNLPVGSKVYLDPIK